MAPLHRWRAALAVMATHLCIFLLPVLAQNCGPSNPCSVGCCSKFGFCGFGASYCAPEVCVFNCDKKADCDPGGLGDAYVHSSKCPLNVCCSKWGYCGMTQEFCGTKTVKSPNCAGSPKAFKRVVGYYEAWSFGRDCNPFIPEWIPAGVYTHINFAFATIDPVTFEVKPANSGDPALYRRLVHLKQRDPNLKVFIAIGGWSFNDAGRPTATTFSDMVSSDAHRNMFIRSLISFMATYGFDGVDLDWEYPVAPDRNGRGEDYQAFPLFLWLLRQSLKTTPSRNGLSITIPASYWYLQHFDIQRMQDHVDFFNVMSYDLHGAWDIKNKWVGAHLNAHTNLTEIDDALSLLWRNQIDPAKVVLGMAFYGRTFRATNPNCLTPGCPYETGAQAQLCSREIGIALNSEIDDIISAGGSTPVLYQDAAVKVTTWDSANWVAFDDEDTFVLKTNYARDKCLGGVMVWAISHDTKEGKYSRALSRAAPILGGSLLQMQTDGTGQVYDAHEQCKWTNCGQACPAGWVAVPRSDEGAKSGEIMQDDQGCEGHGVHTFCCPVGNGVPSCGWYGHNNGQCSGYCPADWKEVSSNNLHCDGGWLGGFQAACCSTAIGFGSHSVKPPNMRLQSQCTWGPYPACQEQCPADMPDLLSQSSGGSGARLCKANFCCANGNPDWQYHSCAWYRGLGAGPEGSDACKSGCPDNQVRIAMSPLGCTRGEQAHCCSVNARSLAKRGKDNEQKGQDLSALAADPVCPSGWEFLTPRSLQTRSVLSPVDFDPANETAIALTRRSVSSTVLTRVEQVTEEMMGGTTTTELRVLWDNTIGRVFPALNAVAVTRFFAEDNTGRLFRAGTSFATFYLLCNLPSLNRELAGTTVPTGRILCPFQSSSASTCEQNPIEKRSRSYTWTVTFQGVTYSGVINSLEYPSINDWNPYDQSQQGLYQRLYIFPDQPCTNLAVRLEDVLTERRNQGPISWGVTEHVIELQTLPMFYQDAIRGTLAGGRAPNPAGTIPADFFQTTAVRPDLLAILSGPVPLAFPNLQLWTIQERFMNAFGTNRNRDAFVLAYCDLNGIKARLWNNDDISPIAFSTMDSMVNGGRNELSATTVLTSIRNVLSVTTYLNVADVHESMVHVLMELRRELRLAERAHMALTGQSIPLVEVFDHWMSSHFRRIERRMVTFANTWLTALHGVWLGDTSAVGMEVLGLIDELARIANGGAITIQETGFYDPV